MSVPAQHQVGTRLKLKPRTKEFNIITHEPENSKKHLDTLTFESCPSYIQSKKKMMCVVSTQSIQIQACAFHF